MNYLPRRDAGTLQTGWEKQLHWTGTFFSGGLAKYQQQALKFGSTRASEEMWKMLIEYNKLDVKDEQVQKAFEKLKEFAKEKEEVYQAQKMYWETLKGGVKVSTF